MRVYQTTPQMEGKAVDDLKKSGATTLAPVEIDHAPRYRRGKLLEPRERLLITGYVITDRKRPESRHVRRYVGSITPGEVARLKEMDGREINKYSTNAKLKIGDSVTIKKGAFAALSGIIIAMNKNHVQLTTTLFGRECEHWVSEAAVERA